MPKSKKTHQIKISITNELYQKLKESAEKNYRTLSQEVNYRLATLLSKPTTSPTLPTPVFIPHDTPGGIRTPIPQDIKPGIPEPPYKITCEKEDNIS